MDPTPRLSGRGFCPNFSPINDFSMSTTAQRNKNLTRPKKSPGEKAKRQRDQKRRLIALGMDETVVLKMTSRKVLDLLKRPAKVVAAK